MFHTIYGFAEKGRLVDAGGFTIFGPEMLFLGRKGPWGLMYLPAEMFNGIDIPADALTAVLIRDFETELIQAGLYYRVATSMAGAYRYYPYPPWSDLDRKAAVTEAQHKKSFLSKVELFKLDGGMARASVLPEPGPPIPAGKDGLGAFGDVVALRIPQNALPELRGLLEDVQEGGAVALLTDPDPSASSRLFWHADSGNTIVLQLPSGPGAWTTGGFLILGHGQGIEDKVSALEDGFFAMLSPGSWEKLKGSTTSGLPIKIPATGAGPSLNVEFLPPGEAKAETTVLAETKMEPDEQAGTVFGVRSVILYNPDEQLKKRGFDSAAMVTYIQELEKAACAVLEGGEKYDARGLLVAVGIKPKKKVKIWCEAVEGGLSQDILGRLEAELANVPTLDVRKGPVAFTLAGPLWGRTMKKTPEFPTVWTAASNRAKKPLTVPDGLFKLIWPD